MMWRYDGGICPFCGAGGGGWGGGGLLMLFFGLLVLVGIVLLIIWAVRQAGGHEGRRDTYQAVGGRGYDEHQYPRPAQMGQSEDAAIAAARHRYARGEITKEELDEILGNLREAR